MNQKSQNFAEFALLLQREFGTAVNETLRLSLDLSCKSRRLARLYNIEVSEHPLTESEKKMVERLESQIREILKPHEATAFFNDDPRGASVFVRPQSGYSNDYADRGITVIY